jgi:hypothetical protein
MTSGLNRFASLLIPTILIALGVGRPLRSWAQSAQLDGEPLIDYDPLRREWNGLSRWAALCSGNGMPVTSVIALEWSELGAEDLLVLMYPMNRVDPDKLEAFITAGGHVIVADDFGGSADAVARLGSLRANTGAPRASRFHADRSFAPIAVPKSDHPLAQQVTEVITNHPAAFLHVQGATEVIGFDEGALIVAGELGTGRFIAVSDPSIFINNMMQFRGNLQLATNMLRWLSRSSRTRRVVLLRGDAPMYGVPKPFIDDARADKFGRDIADLNRWLDERNAWLLTPVAMRGVAAGLALLLFGLIVFALPLRRGPIIDGGWLRSVRPARRDEPRRLVLATDRGRDLLVTASLLRDQIQRLLASSLDKPEPLFSMSRAELLAAVRERFGAAAETELAAMYNRLKALPSRGQAAAPWTSGGELSRAEFDALFAASRALCRSLGMELPL